MRQEREIFNDLAELCSSPGYAHTIAYLCFRDHSVGYSGEMTSRDVEHLFSDTRLVRTELSTLIGLLIKKDVDYRLPASAAAQEYLERTEVLLEEMQRAMAGTMFSNLDSGKLSLETGDALREPIFYGGESAYSFQYRDLSSKKYANDDPWLAANKGFSIRIARDVVAAVGRILDEKVPAILATLSEAPPEEHTILPGYTFTVQAVAEVSGIERAVVERVIRAFALPERERNENFCALHDFNVANAFPLLRVSDETFLLFQLYSLTEALYEGPFYWMHADKAYRATAMLHRGQFTEEFSAERLQAVFGKENVYSNVHIVESKGKRAGEIDVFVLFGNRAIVLQAKSKRLTLEARKGNDVVRDNYHGRLTTTILAG